MEPHEYQLLEDDDKTHKYKVEVTKESGETEVVTVEPKKSGISPVSFLVKLIIFLFILWFFFKK